MDMSGSPALPAVLVAAFAASTAQTVVVAAVPALATTLDVSTSAATWTLTAFLLAGAAATPVLGRLGDLHGHRRVLLWCLALFLAGTLLCLAGVLTRQFTVVLAGRVVAGAAGGVYPLAFGLLRRGPIALLAAMFGVGGATGLVVAGPVVDAFGPAGLFWPFLVLGAVAVVLTAGVGEHRAEGRPTSVGAAGAVLLAATLVCLLLGISQFLLWPPVVVAASFACSSVLARVFWRHELLAPAPLLGLRLLRDPVLARLNVVAVVLTAALFGVVTLLPRLLQDQGATATEAGLALAPMAVLMLAGAPLTPWLRRVDRRAPLWVGAACAVGSAVVLAVAPGQAHWVVGCVGVGYGFVFAGLGTLVADAAEDGRLGAASGVHTVARTVGGAIGAQVAAAIADHAVAFAVFAAVAAVAFAASVPRSGRTAAPR